MLKNIILGIELKSIIQVFLYDVANIMFNMKIRKFVNKIHKQVICFSFCNVGSQSL